MRVFLALLAGHVDQKPKGVILIFFTYEAYATTYVDEVFGSRASYVTKFWRVTEGKMTETGRDRSDSGNSYLDVSIYLQINYLK